MSDKKYRLAYYNCNTGRFKGFVDDTIYTSIGEAYEAKEIAQEDFSMGRQMLEAMGQASKSTKNIVIEVEEV